jgi:hypothetical protein
MGTVTTARPFSVAAAAHPPANAIATCLSSASEPNVQDGPLFPAAAASAMGMPAFSSGSELQDRSNGLHPHIVNGLALAHCSTSSHHHVWIGAVKRSHVRLSLHPRGPGSSPGRVEFFFILEFLVEARRRRHKRCAPRIEPLLLLMSKLLLSCSLHGVPLHVILG